MIVLFADFDGVLNSKRLSLPPERAASEVEYDDRSFDKEAVERLNRIVERTGCEVVVSSHDRDRTGDRGSRKPTVDGVLRILRGATVVVVEMDRDLDGTRRVVAHDEPTRTTRTADLTTRVSEDVRDGVTVGGHARRCCTQRAS